MLTTPPPALLLTIQVSNIPTVLTPQTLPNLALFYLLLFHRGTKVQLMGIRSPFLLLIFPFILLYRQTVV